MKLKRILALLLAVIMVFMLAACSKGKTDDTNASGGGAAAADGDTYELKIVVWTPEAAVEFTKQQIEEFNKTNTYQIKVVADVNPQTEASATTQMLNDVNSGADIFFFAQDQFARLVRGGALDPVPSKMATTIEADNDDDVINAGIAGDTLYAYPLTNDNGYFMYYDKSVIPEEDVGSLEKLIADCEAKGKYFNFEVNAWYLVSFFFATGCNSKWVTDDAGNFISIEDNFNSDKGLIAAKGLEKLVKSEAHVSSADAAKFKSDAAIVVSGTWDYNVAKDILGDNMGCAKLPKFTVDGNEYQMGTFSGCKLLGVKPQSDGDRSGALHILAQYLTSKEQQQARFKALGWGPAYKGASEDPEVKKNPALMALWDQFAAKKVPQGQVEGSWWDIAALIAEDIKEAQSEEDLKAALQKYDDKISAVFNKTEDEKSAWSVIGMYNTEDGFFFTDYVDETRENWKYDLPLVKVSEGVFKTEQAYDIPEGCEFKVRQGASWDVSFGADGENFKVETAGKYYIVFTFDGENGVITLEAG